MGRFAPSLEGHQFLPIVHVVAFAYVLGNRRMVRTFARVSELPAELQSEIQVLVVRDFRKALSGTLE